MSKAAFSDFLVLMLYTSLLLSWGRWSIQGGEARLGRARSGDGQLNLRNLIVVPGGRLWSSDSLGKGLCTWESLTFTLSNHRSRLGWTRSLCWSGSGASLRLRLRLRLGQRLRLGLGSIHTSVSTPIETAETVVGTIGVSLAWAPAVGDGSGALVFRQSGGSRTLACAG